jgi:ABC-2 type transport system permease protein
MSDLFVKYIADITPTRFFRVFLAQDTAIDNTSIILFISYLVIFLLLNLKIFSKKEMLH